ncbi:FMN-dependent NADH-azoreductase [Terriglobus roseus]|uniref:FMN dependent NADH:quinone oxidoreductase n=1 Tax=Terriglobus roseus TaxID=392734 RepID=A0A1H4MSC4_9BACT|nr:NAD(P)H-dependent oxidoreductase [Terriglobus roseus]SEB85747.1 FMN-dependent NADH-azoreductase [Terriglobus roseus]
MPTLLHIDSSPLYDRSISRALTSEFVTQWKAAHPDGKVVVRDLNATVIPPIDAAWVGAVFTPEEAQTPEQKEIVTLSNTLLAELFEADEYVIGVPMHNFGPPSVLKLWVDQIARVGKTFSYADGTPKGLIVGKKATFLIATGGIYDAQTQMASYNFVEPYLRSVFGFLGVTDATFFTAGGVQAVNHGKVDRKTFLVPHLQAVQAHVNQAL